MPHDRPATRHDRRIRGTALGIGLLLTWTGSAVASDPTYPFERGLPSSTAGTVAVYSDLVLPYVTVRVHGGPGGLATRGKVCSDGTIFSLAASNATVKNRLRLSPDQHCLSFDESAEDRKNTSFSFQTSSAAVTFEVEGDPTSWRIGTHLTPVTAARFTVTGVPVATPPKPAPASTPPSTPAPATPKTPARTSFALVSGDPGTEGPTLHYLAGFGSISLTVRAGKTDRSTSGRICSKGRILSYNAPSTATQATGHTDRAELSGDQRCLTFAVSARAGTSNVLVFRTDTPEATIEIDGNPSDLTLGKTALHPTTRSFTVTGLPVRTPKATPPPAPRPASPAPKPSGPAPDTVVSCRGTSIEVHAEDIESSTIGRPLGHRRWLVLSNQSDQKLRLVYSYRLGDKRVSGDAFPPGWPARWLAVPNVVLEPHTRTEVEVVKVTYDYPAPGSNDVWVRTSSPVEAFGEARIDQCLVP